MLAKQFDEHRESLMKPERLREDEETGSEEDSLLAEEQPTPQLEGLPLLFLTHFVSSVV